VPPCLHAEPAATHLLSSSSTGRRSVMGHRRAVLPESRVAGRLTTAPLLLCMVSSLRHRCFSSCAVSATIPRGGGVHAEARHRWSRSSRCALCPPRAARAPAEGLPAPWAEIALGCTWHCASGPRWLCGHGLHVTVPLGHGGFGPLAVELFFYFLNIFKSLQIKKFV
jgi:hypothetical protein